MNDDRLQILLEKYRVGTLTEEDRSEFERTLLSSPQAREAFWEHARFHALLARWGQEEWGRKLATAPADAEAESSSDGPSPTAAPPAERSPRFIRIGWLPWLVAAAACIALVVMLSRYRNHWEPVGPIASTGMPPTTIPAGVAVVAASVDVKWANAASGRAVGSVLQASSLKLDSGTVQIEFYSGARLIIQGPAEVQLVSEMEAFCRNGRVTAYVPTPARGFRVAAPGFAVVDLGTEFGMNVPLKGPPEVHVFTGAVTLSRSKATTVTVTLFAGEAARVETESLKPMAASRSGFIEERELARLVSSDSLRRKETWQNAAATLSRDPATLLHFTFDGESDGGRTLTNRAVGARSVAGSMVGCGWVSGRWNGGRAIEFKGPGDRIRIDVPGRFTAVTLLAWLRIDALPSAYDALLAPDGLAPGTLRWGLSGHGELRLGIARESGKPEPNWEVVITPPVVTTDRLGKWVMIATAFDGKTLSHYMNGQIVKTGAAYSPVPLVIGPAEVGNWRGETPRFLKGRMDELAILSRAMTAQEIKALYDAGVGQ